MVFSEKKSGQQKRKGGMISESTITILTAGCHFDGNLFCKGSSRIGGRVEGKIVSEGLLIIEEGARINAEIKADEVIIQGEVKGRLTATKRVELSASSRFEGDIITPSMIILEGARFDGSSTMSKSVEEISITEPSAKFPTSKNSKKPGAEAGNRKIVNEVPIVSG